MTKQEKQQFIEQWTEELKDVSHGVLIDYRGLTVSHVDELRSKIREAGASYRVVKNTLARIVVPATKLAPLEDHFFGPMAIAYTANDPVDLAKALIDFGKGVDVFEIKVGSVDGQLLETVDIKELSTMASREELLAKLLYVMKFPVQGLATSLNGVIRNLAVVLNQVADGK